MNGTQQQLLTYSSTTIYAYPDSVTVGPSTPQLTTSATYNSYTGLVATLTDANSKTTSYSYDTMKRLTDVQRSDSQHLYYTYDDSARWMRVDSPVDSSQRVKQKTEFDSLGRPLKKTVTDTIGSSYYIVEIQYDALSRPYKLSNPHNSTAQYWTETRFDALDRPTKVIPPDGSASSNNTSYSYSVNTATMTDPAGKQRKSETDSLARLTKVSEPDINQSNQLLQDTTYAYNILDLLTGVSQGSQSRSYAYDDMGRMTQEVTPEASTWNYTFNAFDQVATRTDARNVVTTYTYDTLNRLYTVSYNVGSTGVPATNTITYTYGTNSTSNNNGRLTNVTNTTASDALTYDTLGRVTQDDRVINSATYTTQYIYNLARELTQITYPSGRVVKRDFDAIGRLSKLYKDASTTYADTFGYNAAGQATGFNYGNGVTASFGYSTDRLQLSSLIYVKSSQSLMALNYYYKTDASNCPNAPSGNNGEIQCIKDNSDTTLTPGAGGRSVTYTYDALYRLSTAVTTGSTQYPAWGLSWTYDRYGNRTAQSILSGCTGLTCPAPIFSVSATTNRITDSWAVYDTNGNMTNDGLNTLGYDAENHMVSSAGWSYVLDGSGVRVRRCTPNCTSPTSNTVYIFNGSQVIAEYDNGAAVASPTREYIYNGNKLLAKFESGATVYYHLDHLSNRLTSNSSGTILGQFGYFPFGESCYVGAIEKWRFTSYERDTESSNDYAMFRYHVYRLGRFSSADPIGGSVEDPQSNNRYAYVTNDPANFTDPLGLWRPPPPPWTPPSPPAYWMLAGAGNDHLPPPRTTDSNVQKGSRGGLEAGIPTNLPLTRVVPILVPPVPPCIAPSLAQRAIISGLGVLARASGTTVGVGFGGSASFGMPPYPGMGPSTSVQIVVSPNGQAALEKSYGFGGTFGSPGAVGGVVVSVSNASNPQALAGPFGQASGSYANGFGGGVDVAFSGKIAQVSVMGGGGGGGWGAFSASQQTLIQPFCPAPR